MSQRFSYIKYNQHHTMLSESFKRKFEEVETLIDVKIDDGRAKSLALTKLEEAYMWIGKAIRDMQIKEEGKYEHISERGC